MPNIIHSFITSVVARSNHPKQKSTSKNRFEINQNVLIIAVSLYLVLTANISFLNKVLDVYPLSQNIGFILSLAGLLFALLWLVIQIMSYRFTVKFILISMVMISAVTAYFTDTYGTIFDTNMLINSLQTDSAEAGDLLSIGFLLRVLIFGLVPSILIAKIHLTKLSWKQGVIQKTTTLLSSLALIVVCLLPFGDQYASFFREHKPLRYYTTPITPIYSSIKLGTSFIADMRRPNALIRHATDAKKTSTVTMLHSAKPKLMVFVVGEAARADHISLNGYKRETTPLLSKQTDVYSYKNATSCGTSTAYSVPCMFSYANQSDYDVDLAKYNENVVDTLSKQGVNVIWRDNNSSSKGVADRVIYEDFRTHDTNPVCDIECRDIGMLTGFEELLENSTTGASNKVSASANAPQDTLVVLHQMGNHGPAYNKRYPKDFEIFTPVCTSNDLSKCDTQTIVNGYDNAIRYTDYFLNSVIETLKQYENDYDVVMIYMSDHGESLGENNIYLHGLPYSIAPQAQKRIPAIIWSPSTNGINADNIQRKLNIPVSHDYITPTLLNFFNITTQETAGQPSFFESL